ncbi:MAG: hypothetical protein MUD01_15645 [Chloroflexaceae bacterium]|jgi:hypothetical protein|nr:hypothetical protein [Chloroflexaceae bacterium]
MQLLRHLQQNERGSALVGWVGMAAAVFGLVVAIWVAFYGPPGQVLKGTVQRAVTEYAHGFEGGLGTSGPTGGTPRIEPVEPPRQSPPGQPGSWNVPGTPIGKQFLPTVPNPR